MLKYILVALCTTSMLAERNLTIKTEAYECGNTKVKLPSNQKGVFNYQILGHDYDNTPVVLLQWGIWDLRWLAGQPIEKEIFRQNYYQWIEEISNGTLNERLKLDFWETSDIVFIIDFNKFKYVQMASANGMKFSMKLFAKLQQLSSKIAYSFFVNANPLAYQMASIAKPLMANLLEHNEMYGTNDKIWKPQLMKKIPRDQLPPSLGGNENFMPLVECDFL